MKVQLIAASPVTWNNIHLHFFWDSALSSSFFLVVGSSPAPAKNKRCIIWKTIPMTEKLTGSRPHDKISVFSEDISIPGAPGKKQRHPRWTLEVKNRDRAGIGRGESVVIRLSLFDESRVPLIAAIPVDRRLNRRCSFLKRTLSNTASSIMSASLRAQSSALCACHCSPFHRPYSPEDE